jgi:AcrR family transcriptional regulator
MASLPEHLSAAPAGRQRLSREVIASHQRNRTLDAAIEVFAKRGYMGTTIDHIVAAARIGVGSFYELFAGKEDCFLAAYDRALASGREQLSAAVPPAAPWPEQAYAAVRSLFALFATEPFAARLVLVEAQTAGPRALARFEATLDTITPLLRRGRAFSPIAGELPAMLEEAVLGGLVWFLQQRLVLGELDGGEQLFADALGLVLDPYLGEAAAAELIAAAPSTSG